MLETRLSKLLIRNFKSIPFAAIEFSEMNFIVGRNGSGKSNISDAFAFISEAMEQPLQSVLNRRGGPHSVAHRTPTTIREPFLRSQPVPMGFALEFSSVPSYSYSKKGPIIRAKYALQITTSRMGYVVDREQCVIEYEDKDRVWWERTAQGFQSNISYLKTLPERFLSRDSLAIQVLGGVDDFSGLTEAMRKMSVYSIEPVTLREFQNHDPGVTLSADGSNAASVIRALGKSNPSRFRRLLEILSAIVPDLDEIRSVSVGRKQLLRFYQAWEKDGAKQRLVFDAFNMSDGTLRSLGILLAVFQRNRPSLLLIEEPETSIHPGAVGAILELLRSESKSMQVIITTHSPEVLDYASFDDVIKVVNWDRGRTRVDGVYGAAKEALKQHLTGPGELFRMRVLDAPVLFEEEELDESLFEDLA